MAVIDIRIKKMANLKRGFMIIIYLSRIYFRQLQNVCKQLLRLWLYQERLANTLFISQESFRKSAPFFRHRILFVVDLPIRLMKFSLTMDRINIHHSMNLRGRWLFISSLLLTFITGLVFKTYPVEAQAQNGIVQPASGDVLSGIVIVQGTATDGNFLRYELAFLQESGPSSDWIVFAQGDQPVIGGTLAVWDTTVGQGTNPVFPDGRYQLRLRVVRQDFNYDEYYVTNLTIANTGTPTPTPTSTAPVVEQTAAPSGVETALPVLTQAAPEILPSLTPFPTPSPQATPLNEPLGPGVGDDEEPAEERQGVFEQISGIDAGQFESAFWQGVRFVAIIFGFLAAYLLLRGVLRRLWRLLLNKLLR
jgi:hypothetical protein